MLRINNKFNLGDMVYILSDADQNEYQIIYILVTPIGLIYGVSKGGEVVDCYEIELSATKKVI